MMTWYPVLITVSAHIERRHSIKIKDFQAVHNGHFLVNFVKNILLLDKRLLKMTKVSRNSAPWRSNKSGSLYVRIQYALKNLFFQ